MKNKLTHRESGKAMWEFTMICLVLFVTSMTPFDLGFSAYAFISVENAARVAGARNSSGWDSATDQASPGTLAVAGMQNLPLVGSGYQGNCKSGAVA